MISRLCWHLLSPNLFQEKIIFEDSAKYRKYAIQKKHEVMNYEM